MKTPQKKKYSSPKVDIMTVELEQGIAAGSGTGIVKSSDSQSVKQEWSVAPDDVRTLDW